MLFTIFLLFFFSLPRDEGLEFSCPQPPRTTPPNSSLTIHSLLSASSYARFLRFTVNLDALVMLDA